MLAACLDPRLWIFLQSFFGWVVSGSSKMQNEMFRFKFLDGQAFCIPIAPDIVSFVVISYAA